MRKILSIYLILFFNPLFSQSKKISDVKEKYLQSESITMKIKKIMKGFTSHPIQFVF
jgi:hypothetical protein